MSKVSKFLSNKSIAFQIWIVFSVMMLFIISILVTISLLTFKNFLYDKAYELIENSQKNVITNMVDGKNYTQFSGTISENNNGERILKSIIYPIAATENIDNILSDEKSSEELWNKVLNQYQNQTSDSQRYTYVKNNDNVFYVIRKYSFDDKSGFVFSYTRDLQAEKLYKQIARKIILMTIIASFFSLIIVRKLASYLSKPIQSLKENVEKIGQKEWNTPISVDRKDEIGELSEAIESMRQQLVKNDEAQQWMLQNISHELKTPVMVIRSYAQSVGDGIFPKGDLSSTMFVIDSEAERLEKRIKDLLYLTKLDYLLQHKRIEELVNMKELIEETVDRFRFRREELSWKLELENIIILGDYEQWKVVVENILENSIRYSRSKVRISVKTSGDSILLEIYNDGECIEESSLNELFKPFKKGKKGKFGLGLAIAKRIIESYDGHIWVTNENVGVSFKIELKK